MTLGGTDAPVLDRGGWSTLSIFKMHRTSVAVDLPLGTYEMPWDLGIKERMRLGIPGNLSQFNRYILFMHLPAPRRLAYFLLAASTMVI